MEFSIVTLVYQRVISAIFLSSLVVVLAEWRACCEVSKLNHQISTIVFVRLQFQEQILRTRISQFTNRSDQECWGYYWLCHTIQKNEVDTVVNHLPQIYPVLYILLVGGLEHEWMIFPITSWEFHHPNISQLTNSLHHFSEG